MKDILDIIIQRIVEDVTPQKIILFGSAARNNAEKFNDIDLLIIVKDGVHRRHTAQYLYKTIRSGEVSTAPLAGRGLFYHSHATHTCPLPGPGSRKERAILSFLLNRVHRVHELAISK